MKVSISFATAAILFFLGGTAASTRQKPDDEKANSRAQRSDQGAPYQAVQIKPAWSKERASDAAIFAEPKEEIPQRSAPAIEIPGQTAAREDRNQERLVLSENEKMFVRREVFGREISTARLGTVSEGAVVARMVEAQDFPKMVIRKVPQLTRYKFIAAEDLVAVIDPQLRMVRLVIEGHH
jgi:hypothetical protein